VAFKIAESFVKQPSATLSHANREAADRVLVNVSHAGQGSHAHAFGKAADDRYLLFFFQDVWH
jgi:hypothetical protein